MKLCKNTQNLRTHSSNFGLLDAERNLNPKTACLKHRSEQKAEELASNASQPVQPPFNPQVAVMGQVCLHQVWPISTNIFLFTCLPIKRLNINPLTADIRGSGYTFFVKWHRYLGSRLERYLQNGAVIQMPGFTHSSKIEKKVFTLKKNFLWYI